LPDIEATGSGLALLHEAGDIFSKVIVLFAHLNRMTLMRLRHSSQYGNFGLWANILDASLFGGRRECPQAICANKLCCSQAGNFSRLRAKTTPRAKRIARSIWMYFDNRATDDQLTKVIY
jgi:hypothetical protein